MFLKKAFLIFASAVVVIIGVLYGASPKWFMSTFLDAQATTDLSHILRAIMCLYFGMAVYWFQAAFNDKHRNPALLSAVFFGGGLLLGRIVSFVMDGKPSILLLVYIGMEVSLVPIALWIYKLPDTPAGDGAE